MRPASGGALILSCAGAKKLHEKWALAWVPNQAGRIPINGPGQLHVAPDQSHSTTCRVSIRAVRSRPADNIHLQFDSIVVLNHGSNEELVYSPKESSLHVLPALVFPDGKELLAAGLRNNALSIEVIRISLVAHEAVDLGEISGNFDPAWGEREKPSYSARP